MTQRTILGVLATILLVVTLVFLGRIGGGVSAQGNPTPSPDLEEALERAADFSGSNTDWTPVIQEFDGVEMVLVPAGCFMMGSEEGYDNEKPVHQVCFAEPFWIDRTEVTNGQFAAFKGQTVEASYFSGDDRPRERITWTEAQAYCERRGARLPTEAEWEYAARGPDGLVYPWGDMWDQNRVIGYRSDDEGTAPVGSRLGSVSWVGALDMSGNVWEWVADWYGAYSSAQQTDPTGPAFGKYRVFRGGGWYYPPVDGFRASSRGGPDPQFKSDDVGFRCARSMDIDAVVFDKVNASGQRSELPVVRPG